MPAPDRDWPLARSRWSPGPTHPWWGDVIERDPALADRIMGEIRERGALGVAPLRGRAERRRDVEQLKPAKRMLEALWYARRLVIGARDGFQRMYDLPERVMPDAVLAAPVPDEDEVLRRLVVPAVEARGALTESGVVEHWRLKGGMAGIRPYVDEPLPRPARSGARTSTTAARRFCAAGAEPEAARPGGAVLLSPFDNLLWDRPFAERVLGLPPSDRGLQAGSGAALRLLRPAAGRRRPRRRPRRRQGRPQGRRADRRSPGTPSRGSFSRPRRAARAGVRPARPPARPCTLRARLAAVEFETRAIHAGQDPTRTPAR